MLDALFPAARAARAALDGGGDLAAVTAAARDAAAAGAAATIPMLATKGRASYLGERSVGHQDPGATSSALLLAVLADGAAGTWTRQRRRPDSRWRGPTIVGRPGSPGVGVGRALLGLGGRPGAGRRVSALRRARRGRRSADRLRVGA